MRKLTPGQWAQMAMLKALIRSDHIKRLVAETTDGQRIAIEAHGGETVVAEHGNELDEWMRKRGENARSA
jgi:hypothetical protein